MGRIENRPGYEIMGNKGDTNDQTLGNAKMLKIDYKMLKESKQAQSAWNNKLQSKKANTKTRKTAKST